MWLWAASFPTGGVRSSSPPRKRPRCASPAHPQAATVQVTSICFDPEYDKWMGALAAGGHLAIEAWDVEELDTCDMEVDLTENLTEMHSERRRYAAERKNSEQLGQVEWLTNTSTSLSV
ncbi:unnamed protein product [Durusdinium trenchii]|uniref:Uncharacterized protein n=1 Tax=Durusdinium trenchii TaxID=1381693 RepID=A0ABP0HVQ9_9DINO